MTSTRVIVDGIVMFAPNVGVWALPEVGHHWAYGVMEFAELREKPNWRLIAAAIAEVFEIQPDRLIGAIQTGLDHWMHPLLYDACCGPGGNGPLEDLGDITFEDFLGRIAVFEEEQRILAATKAAKRSAMKARRSQFSAQRDHLILALLDSGVPYKCAHPGCSVAERLTIDHRLALSRGGTDAIDNLQFMCVSHNSAKGDRAQ